MNLIERGLHYLKKGREDQEPMKSASDYFDLLVNLTLLKGEKIDIPKNSTPIDFSLDKRHENATAIVTFIQEENLEIKLYPIGERRLQALIDEGAPIDTHTDILLLNN